MNILVIDGQGGQLIKLVKEKFKDILPINKCDNIVAGISDLSTTTILNDVIEKIKNIIE